MDILNWYCKIHHLGLKSDLCFQNEQFATRTNEIVSKQYLLFTIYWGEVTITYGLCIRVKNYRL